MSDYDQLEFRHLKYIEAVAKTGTITAAAELVNTTQRWLGLFEQIPAIPKWRVCLG